MTALLIGVHHVSDGPGAMAIILGTQSALKGDWILGPKYPATHAFPVIELEGYRWRLDGKPSRAEWSPYKPSGGHPPEALWRIQAPQNAVRFGIDRARSITHAAYDWSEILASTAVAFGVLPFAHKLKLLGRQDLSADAMICTQVCRQVLLATDPNACDGMITAMPDLFPERLGQILRMGEGKWTERV